MKVIRLWLTDGSTASFAGRLTINIGEATMIHGWIKVGHEWFVHRYEVASALVTRLQVGRSHD